MSADTDDSPLTDDERTDIKALRNSDDPGVAAFADELLRSLEGGE